MYGIAQKAIRGELNELQAVTKSNSANIQSPTIDIEEPESKSPYRQKVQAHIDHLKQLLVVNR